MRKWYWLLLILFPIAASMLLLSTYYIGTTESLGPALLVYGTIIMSFLFAMLFLQFERWRRRWEQKQEEGTQTK
jgi:predicted tellurium resistance membrane protein TerC